ncbi:MAG: DUF308 domain-containing protein, partial [Acidimicrobiia bacterium]|nr:DUF308 domain-containing protein [Acidimicrobiia bacterium]
MIVTNPFSDLRSWTRDQVEAVSRGWWTLLVMGVISVVAGGIIIAGDWTVSGLVVFVGALLVFRGFFTLFSVPVDGSQRTWSFVMGLIEVGVGVSVWAWPGPTLLMIAFFIGWLLLFRGITAIAGAVAARRAIPYWGWILVVGIVEVLVSFYLLSRPALTLVAAVLAIGLVAMFYGVVEIGLSFEVKHLPERFDDLTKALDHDRNGSRRLERTP